MKKTTKKKITKKKKLGLGGTNQTQPSGEASQTVESAASFVPLWGEVYNATRSGSKMISGDGTDTTANAAANVISPSTGVTSAIDDGAYGDAIITAFNPIGGGKLASDRAKAKQKQAERDRAAQWTMNASEGVKTLPTFKTGGNLSVKPKVIGGGTLERISPDAVQVKATNPSQTDSVELPQAYVDHNEVIDKKDRVFSDVLTTSSGKTIASEAAKLEKMKATGGRFQASNSKIDTRLDNLFNQQEQMKTHSTGVDTSAARIKTSKPAPATSLYDQMNFRYQTTFDKKGNLNKVKPSYDEGGKLKYDPNAFEDDRTWSDHTNAWAESDASTTTGLGKGESKGKGFNWGSLASGVANFGSDAVNVALAAKMPKPPSAQRETAVQLERFRPGAQLAENARLARNASKAVLKTTTQGSVAAANLGSILAKRFYADNAVNDNINQMNASVNNHEAALNTGVNARNTDRINNFNLLKTEQKNRQLSAYSQIASNVGTKIGKQKQEQNYKDLSLTQLEVLKKQYEDSGVYDRALNDAVENLKKKQGLRKGGKLKKC